MPIKISDEAQRYLVKAARLSIGSIFGYRKPEQPDYQKYPELKSKSGAFVTLTVKNKLRGCIGYIQGMDNLFETVCNAAVQAASSDPRFSPLTEKEFDEVLIEISVIGNFKKIKSYEEIEIGKHGLLLDEGNKGLLLPQVATEHRMNREQFITALCHKTGMYGNYWKERLLNIKTFTAIVFSENDFKEVK